ncbi:hypothetical protein EDB81DRAFT_942334 [Dactylonectria macrodidyma]|uniref:Uncharacterized protein n=1 Tax=Dactylonectria macrodidyma TaxID=307937 RepID=A0A9P9FMP9_9HYPO|nr:hypothetical protein EDB81DRAFT_942334 [Dactylonectria macrodidyma]
MPPPYANQQPYRNEQMISNVLEGVLKGDLSLHYLRWIEPNVVSSKHILLELGFWIGPCPGEAPYPSLHAKYANRTHTKAVDRWIVMHVHIPLDQFTFTQIDGMWSIGVTTLTMYLSHAIYNPLDRTKDPQPEFRFADTVLDGALNKGIFKNYNSRSQVLRCFWNTRKRWYLGAGSISSVKELPGTPRPTYLETLDQFGNWLCDQGILDAENLAYMWPKLGSLELADDGWTIVVPHGKETFDPELGAFDTNWLPGGELPAPVMCDSVPSY